MRVNQVEAHPAAGAAKIAPQGWNSNAVRLSGNGHAGIKQRFAIRGLGMRGVAGRHIEATVPHALKRLAVGEHNAAHAVQRGRIGLAKLADDQVNGPLSSIGGDRI